MSDRRYQILDADYHSADLNQVTAAAIHPTMDEQKQLNFLLKRYEYVFDGTLGKWKSRPVDIKLKEGVKPYHAKPFPVPHSLETPTKKECERLGGLGVLRKINHSEWAAPTFIRPKRIIKFNFYKIFEN